VLLRILPLRPNDNNNNDDDGGGNYNNGNNVVGGDGDSDNDSDEGIVDSYKTMEQGQEIEREV